MQDPECGVVVAGDDDQRMIGTDAGIEPDEQSMLGYTRRHDVSGQSVERRPHLRPRLDVSPPVFPIGLAAVLLAHRVDVLLDPAERFFVQRGVAC